MKKSLAVPTFAHSYQVVESHEYSPRKTTLKKNFENFSKVLEISVYKFYLVWSTSPRYMSSVRCSSFNFFTRLSLHRMALRYRIEKMLSNVVFAFSSSLLSTWKGQGHLQRSFRPSGTEEQRCLQVSSLLRRRLCPTWKGRGHPPWSCSCSPPSCASPSSVWCPGSCLKGTVSPEHEVQGFIFYLSYKPCFGSACSLL